MGVLWQYFTELKKHERGNKWIKMKPALYGESECNSTYESCSWHTHCLCHQNPVHSSWQGLFSLCSQCSLSPPKHCQLAKFIFVLKRYTLEKKIGYYANCLVTSSFALHTLSPSAGHVPFCQKRSWHDKRLHTLWDKFPQPFACLFVCLFVFLAIT